MERDRKLHEEISLIADEKFLDPDQLWTQHIGSRLRKLGEELGEMHEAIYCYCGGNFQNISEEIADVAIVLSHILHLVSLAQWKEMTLLEVMEAKWTKNKAKWEANNGK